MQLDPSWVAVGLTVVNVAAMLFDRISGRASRMAKAAAASDARWTELMSRQTTHEHICEQRQVGVDNAIGELKRGLHEANIGTHRFRNKLANKLTKMEVGVLVLCAKLGVKLPVSDPDPEDG